ncbi:MAG: stage II sporulation protein M [Methanotrichaceae archaeon]
MNWKDDVTYLRSIRSYIFLSVLFFLGSSILGFVAASRYPELAATQIEEVGKMFGWILNLSPPLMMAAIFLNNLFTSTIAMLLGVGFGVVPAIVVTMNGIMVGIVAYHAISTEGTTFLVAAILPHGILELPIVLICIGAGFRLGHVLLLSIQGNDANLGDEMRAALRLLRWVVPLLFLAAMIETFITPILIQSFISPLSIPVME